MNESARRLGCRLALLAALVAASACTSLGGATLPRPPPAPAPAPQPQPGDTRSNAPAPLPAPPPRANRPAPQPPSSAAAPRPQSDARSASSALLAQSRAERAAGRHAAATASIERALRLDPNNAELWIERGELELSVGNASQAATMARKALTLTNRNGALAARAERLLRASGG